MLNIKNLHVAVGGEEIIKGLDLEVGSGELHAVMGPNGSGKSTLGYALAGRDGYDVTDGSVEFDGRIFWIWKSRSARRPGFSWRCNTRSRSRASTTPIFCAPH